MWTKLQRQLVMVCKLPEGACIFVELDLQIFKLQRGCLQDEKKFPIKEPILETIEDGFFR